MTTDNEKLFVNKTPSAKHADDQAGYHKITYSCSEEPKSNPGEVPGENEILNSTAQHRLAQALAVSGLELNTQEKGSCILSSARHLSQKGP